jgi:hypothetical protein
MLIVSLLGRLNGWNYSIEVEVLDSVDVKAGIVGHIALGVNITTTSNSGGGDVESEPPTGSWVSGTVRL